MKLVVYHRQQFTILKQKLLDAGKKVTSITYFLDKALKDDLSKNCVIDISSLLGLAKTNDSIQLQFEQLIKMFPADTLFIAEDKHIEEAKYILRYCIDEIELSDVNITNEDVFDSDAEKSIIQHNVKKIIDLSEEETKRFIAVFSNQLYGHQKFKNEFSDIVSSFRIFNKIGEHKVLSLFLMGDSGVGKTEVARAIHKAIGGKKKLAKINFGNYSSRDALNNLIGSPLGYIGSDGGELLKRINETDVGVILIDEFEKADTPVFNYFLDVLENGKITNTRAEEYDINGFILVFTSNITKADFENRISPELRSRFDYVGLFNLLSNEDKTKFVKYRFSEIIKKYEQEMKIKLPTNAHTELVSKIDVENYKNMRHLNKKIKDLFVKYVEHMQQ